jgi:RNA polymerase sigma factor (sigma-70 family)
MASRKKNWTLTQDALDKLLALFDEEPERAGVKYELMRAKLIRFFQSRRCSPSHELADEVFNRIARRAQEGEEIRHETLTDYFYGFAHNVLKEFLRNPENAFSSLDAMPSPEQVSVNPDKVEEQASEKYTSEQRFECLESCLAKLPPDMRNLIVSYYEAEEAAKIRNRRRLASSLGVGANALRIRVHRIRAKLEECVSKCINRRAGHETDSRFQQ